MHLLQAPFHKIRHVLNRTYEGLKLGFPPDQFLQFILS